MWPKRRIAAVALPILALALVGVAETRWRTIGTRRAPYQEGEVQRAQAAFRKVVEPNSIVITSEDIGRPAENIEYYSGVAQALYLTDLERWKIDIETIAFRYLTNGKAVYLMIPRNQRGREALFAKLPAEKGWIVDRVLQIEPQQNYDYFIAAPFHRGVAVELWRIRSLPSETYFKSIGGRPMKPTATP